ncbi:Zn-ribbon domain-containing OB-fold protein [Jatrophihabitans sp. DSM 45814]
MTQETTAVAPVLPAPNSLTSFFWDGAREHKLMIQKCNNCGRFQHWPEPVCNNCLSFDLGHGEVSGRGTVYSYEIATQAFHPYFADKLPFVIAVVELVEQPNLKLITNLIDFPLDGIEVGAPVEVTFRPLDENFNLPVFRPAAG